jgi:LysR family transcriptional regulator, hypochlorite-specific transcription factor HypT
LLLRSSSHSSCAAGPSDYELTMEVRMYRERPESARHVKPAAQELWELLRNSKPPG